MKTTELSRSRVDFHPSRMPYLATVIKKIGKRDPDALPGINNLVSEIHTQLVNNFEVFGQNPDAKFPFSYASSTQLSPEFSPHIGKQSDKKIIVFHQVGSGGNPSSGIDEAIITLSGAVAAGRDKKDVPETIVYSLGYPTNPGGEVTDAWNQRAGNKKDAFKEHARIRADLINSILANEDPEKTEVYIKSNSMGTWLADYALAFGYIDERWSPKVQLVLNNPPGYFEDEIQGKIPPRQLKRRKRQAQLCLGFKTEDLVQKGRNAVHERRVGQEPSDAAYFRAVAERHETIFEDTYEQRKLKEKAAKHDTSAAIYQPPLIKIDNPIYIYKGLFDLMSFRFTDVWAYLRGNKVSVDGNITRTLVPVGHRPKYYSDEIIDQMIKAGKPAQSQVT